MKVNETQDSPARAEVEDEIKAMADVAARLKVLPEESRRRVISGLADLYGAAPASGASRGGRNIDGIDAIGEDDSPPEFNTLAELFNATKPRDEAEKALVGSYWMQVVQGQSPITGFAVNKEVRHLGHKINIARGMSALQERDPALAIQLRKAGTSKQARKTYKVTDEGVAAVRTAIRQKGFKS